MKVYILLCGLLRSFDETLFPFLDELGKHIDCAFLLNIPKRKQNEDCFTYTKQEIQLNTITKHPNCFLCVQHDPEIPIQAFTKREQAYITQWYRLWTCSNLLGTFEPNESDLVIRIRPDMKLNCTVPFFLDLLKQCWVEQTLWVSAKGVDAYDDTFAMGPYKYMKQYCSFYSTLNLSELTTFYTDIYLTDFLVSLQIPMKRFTLDSSICLSKCKIIAITGDSGVGKSTLATALQKFFPFDSNLLLETDRYHKWERKSDHWKTTTHLNPEANYLEKLADDTFLLKFGEQIEHVDYDHNTGQFTAPEQIESKNYIFLCGLHTLYENIRINTDIKLFIDCQYELKRFWKCRRDMKKRGYSLEQALAIFEKRQKDYNEFVFPQKQHADICIHYSSPDIPDIQSNSEPTIETLLTIQNEHITMNVRDLFQCANASLTQTPTHTHVKLPSFLSIQDVLQKLPESILCRIRMEDIESGCLGIIQILIVLLCFQS